jgi:hypothetical protein
MMTRLLLVGLLLCLPLSLLSAAPGTSYAPAWERSPVKQFSTGEGQLLADGQPMPLMMDFTWSAPEGEAMLNYQGQFLGNAHWRTIGMVYDGKWDWKRVDALYDWAAKHRVYIVICPEIQQGVPYLTQHPEARALQADGKPGEHRQPSFVDDGYRQAMVKGLSELAQHVRDKPYHLGYYPQDEYSYREFVGFEPQAIKAFQDWVVKKHGNLEKVNEAWKAQFARPEDIQPPRQHEVSQAFVDWQEFRRYAMMDFTKLVYDTLKANDPKHLVVWSLPFYGSWVDQANWWAFAPVTDVFMRHGIGYSGGLFRLKMLAAVAAWSGKPANALCMTPANDSSSIQFSYLMDGPQTGISHVCTAGTADNGTYKGAADPGKSWERREPMYSQSRALNDLVRQMGKTYLASKPRTAQVGVFVSDRQVMLQGQDLNALNGLLQICHDLNLDYEIFSEASWDRIKQYKAVILGSCARCGTPQMADDVRQFVQNGGRLIMTDGALITDANNVPAGRPGFGLENLIGSTEASRATVKEVTLLPSETVGNLKTLPVVGELSVRKLLPQTVSLGEIPGQGSVLTLRQFGKGKVLYCGMNPGLPYAAAFTEDFTGVAHRPDKAVRDDQAGFVYDPVTGADQALTFAASRAHARLVANFLTEGGIAPRVQIKGYEQSIAALHCLSFRQGDDYWVGIANRIVLAGKDHEKVPAAEYHQVLTNLPITVALEAGTKPVYAVKMPLGVRGTNSYSAQPEMLRLSGGQFTLPRLTDLAAVVLTDGHDPVLGLELSPTTVVSGQELQLKVRVANPSAKAVTLALQTDGSAGLRTGARTTVTCKPGGTADAILSAEVAPQAAPGYETIQVVAVLPDGRRLLSPSAEVRVLPDIDLQVAGTQATLFPRAEKPSLITLTARNNRPETGQLTVEVKLPQTYVATPANVRLSLGGGEQQETQIQIVPNGAAPLMAEGQLLASLEVAGKKLEQKQALRLAQGAVAFNQPRTVRLSNSDQSQSDAGVTCLENQYLRAEWIAGTATLHSLIPRHLGRDVLLIGDYPIGLTWYQMPGGFAVQKLESDGKLATLVLKGGVDGKVTMTATLGVDDKQVKIVFDCPVALKDKKDFYLMSRVDEDGKTDVTAYPGKAGLVRMTGGRPTVTPQDSTASWLATEGVASKTVLGVAWDFPGLESLLYMPRNPFANYTIFTPRAGVPGKITFWLTAQPGDVRTAEDWYGGLDRR